MRTKFKNRSFENPDNLREFYIKKIGAEKTIKIIEEFEKDVTSRVGFNCNFISTSIMNTRLKYQYLTATPHRPDYPKCGLKRWASRGL